MRKQYVSVALVILTTMANSPAPAFTIHPEVEPNNSYENAQFVSNFVNGDGISGNLWDVETDIDWFRVAFPQRDFGIYRYRISGFDVDRGLVDDLYGAGLAMFQNNVPIGFYDRQRGFGPRTMFYNFGGPLSLTMGIVGIPNGQIWDRRYLMAAAYDEVTPTDLGQFQAGEFRFRDGAAFSDRTAIAIYDAQGNLVPGSYFRNPEGGSFDNRMTLAAGRYYMPIFAGSLARQFASGNSSHHNLPIVMSGNPGDFSGQLRINTLTRNETIDWELSDNGPDEMNWYSFEVVPEPATLLTLGAGAAAMGLFRRRRQP